ncbi:MAG: hypothetical protein AABX96_04430 [Nanoarchaeota archaeon]
MEEISHKDATQIVREYASFLKPIIGEGELSERLIEGLEKLLREKEVRFKNLRIDDPIDYISMVEEGASNKTIGRIRAHLPGTTHQKVLVVKLHLTEVYCS